MRIAQALGLGTGIGLDRLDAQLLLLHALGRQASGRGWLLAHDGDEVDAQQCERFTTLCARRARGEPLAYLTGSREFFGLALHVDARVLVPRPDTETLVEWALTLLRPGSSPRVADLGTGSGAIALAVKSKRPEASVLATDASQAALAVAALNAKDLALDMEFRHADWLAGVAGPFDLVVSNPPYIAAGDPHLQGLAYEPAQALVAGSDGLRDIRTIVAQTPERLRPGGWLLLEHGYDQAAAVRALLAAAGFQGVESRRDLAGIERCSGGRWLELG